MKVVHVLKKIDMIDNDVKELKKLEKSIAKNKSFSTPIYMSIEKQINILLGERIKMLELRIENPPEEMVEEIEGKIEEKQKLKAKARPKQKSKTKVKSRPNPVISNDIDDDDIPMLTQDQIDAKFNEVREKPAGIKEKKHVETEDESVKILDIALEKGTLNKTEIDKEKERKVKFFRENFPSE